MGHPDAGWEAHPFRRAGLFGLHEAQNQHEDAEVQPEAQAERELGKQKQCGLLGKMAIVVKAVVIRGDSVCEY